MHCYYIITCIQKLVDHWNMNMLPKSPVCVSLHYTNVYIQCTYWRSCGMVSWESWMKNTHEKFLICSSASFQTWACPVIKILSKNDRLYALLQLFVAVGCRNASYRQEKCFCFPYLRRKEVSSSSLCELIEGLPLSATETGKSHSHSKLPVVEQSWGCWVSWKSRFMFFHHHLRFHINNNGCWTLLTLCPWQLLCFCTFFCDCQFLYFEF